MYLINKKRIKNNKNLKKDLMPLEVKYLKRKFKINPKKIDKKSFMLLFSMLDGIIIGVTGVCVVNICDVIILQMLLGLILVLALIFIFYEIVGRILVRKGDKK